MNHDTLTRLKTKRVYSIEGNIGAGKTTLFKRLGKMMDDVEFVEEPVGVWENLGGESLLQKQENTLSWTIYEGDNFKFHEVLLFHIDRFSKELVLNEGFINSIATKLADRDEPVSGVRYFKIEGTSTFEIPKEYSR